MKPPEFEPSPSKETSPLHTNLNIPGCSSSVDLDFTLLPSAAENEDQKTFLLDATKSNIASAYEYLATIFKGDVPISKKLHINLSERQRHFAIGTDIHLSAPMIRQAALEGGYFASRNQSLIVHELLHTLVDEETIPMLAEL